MNEQKTGFDNDLSFVLFIIRHFNNPCLVPQTENTIKEFWLNLANESLPNLNPFAQALLRCFLPPENHSSF